MTAATSVATDDAMAPGRRVFCNRTLNLRAIAAVGFDMDYTLIHYRADRWESRAYEHVQRQLAALDWPVANLRFQPELASLGLILDLELGNLVKANRFGHVRKACHGTQLLEHTELRQIYSSAPVDLRHSRWEFMSTLFSLSEACLFMQLVDLLDAGELPEVRSYRALYAKLRSALDAAHVEGELKREIESRPDEFVVLDAELPLTLLDLKHAGKKLALITNSEWSYTQRMMAYAFDRYLPKGAGWRELFDLVIVRARKPAFFSQRAPAYELVDPVQGYFRETGSALELGRVYSGANARLVETSLGVPGDGILYIGDHIYADVHVSKSLFRWRTALVIRELEDEMAALSRFELRRQELTTLMLEKTGLESRQAALRLELQRLLAGYGKAVDGRDAPARSREIKSALSKLRTELEELDSRIAPLAREADQLQNPRWGLLMRCGNDKSHLARQIERHADVYTSRVSNLLAYTPFSYLRAPKSSLPHD